MLFQQKEASFYEYHGNRTIFSYFVEMGLDKEVSIECLNAASLGDAIGLKSYFHSSEGEKERIGIARALGELVSGKKERVIVDELTSYVDRRTAKKVARGICGFLEKYDLCGLSVFLFFFLHFS